MCTLTLLARTRGRRETQTTTEKRWSMLVDRHSIPPLRLTILPVPHAGHRRESSGVNFVGRRIELPAEGQLR